MEGIITGIGDKELGKNLIKPEYDAVINDFIIGKNTILEGLVLNGKNLSAGACVLCGYSGIIDKPKELDTTAYVYGEFTLNSIYGGSGEDDFNIVTSDTELNEVEYIVNPTEITSAGVYYLLLYVNGEKKVDDIDGKQVGEYPLKSYYSAETENVLDNAVISSTATTPTETKTITNELGEEETVIVTDLHLSQPKRVANTEYVHNQIKEEIDYDDYNGNFKDADGNNIGTYTLRRKSKYVIGTASNITPLSSVTGVIIATFPEGFKPYSPFIFVVTAKESLSLWVIECDSNGQCKIINDATFSTEYTTFFGYQCK